jgi:hypothetical protein
MTLSTFTKKVNDLCRQDAVKLNGLFKGVHYDFPERMLYSYYADGLTPRQTIDAINAEGEAEAKAEARCS